VKRNQGTVTGCLLSLPGAGGVNEAAEVGSVKGRSSWSTPSNRSGYESPGGVPPHRTTGGELRIQRSQIGGRTSTERRAHDLDEPLDSEEASTPG